jgi:hypothetical protein
VPAAALFDQPLGRAAAAGGFAAEAFIVVVTNYGFDRLGKQGAAAPTAA